MCIRDRLMNYLTVRDFDAGMNGANWYVAIVRPGSSSLTMFYPTTANPNIAAVNPLELKDILKVSLEDTNYPDDLEIVSVQVLPENNKLVVITRNYHHYVITYEDNKPIVVKNTFVKYGDFEAVYALPTLDYNTLVVVGKSLATNLYFLAYTVAEKVNKSFVSQEYAFKNTTTWIGFADYDPTQKSHYWSIRCLEGSGIKDCQDSSVVGTFSLRPRASRLYVGNSTNSSYLYVHLKSRFDDQLVRVDITRLTHELKKSLIWIFLGGGAVVVVILIVIGVVCKKKMQNKDDETTKGLMDAQSEGQI
eukprot:TRINITY_DN12852_c0_g2_i4.p1 TRINITY_DN12852_c0_g2~~TRINITY_DN12852_c0_g2_i4.p1  ORF type:complete len:305 (+),score=80.43 TRINITY_DN12852_c0_g2_i4:62-976(+)